MRCPISATRRRSIATIFRIAPPLSAPAPQSLIDGLTAVARGDAPSAGARGHLKAGETPRIAFVFSGQGAQWWAMGRELRACAPVFAAALAVCDAALKPYLGTSILAELDRPESETRLGETSVAQPAIFAIQVAIAALLASWGIKPDAVTGHSVGEIAAAHVAGALKLMEAVRLVAERGRIMQEATGLGRMASVGLTEADAAAIARASNGLLSVAAVNAPRACVLSGDATALDAALTALAARGVAHQMLPVNYAFHSAQMAPFEVRLSEAMSDITSASAPIPMVSTVTGAPIDGAALDGRYWGRNLRDTVRFMPAVEQLLASGIDTFVEIAPHPVLGSSIAAVCDHERADAAVVATLRRNRPESQSLRQTLAAIYVRGGRIAWSGVFADGGARVALPAYPWQRSRHWLKAAPTVQRAVAGHPLLGRRITSPALKGPVFEARISAGIPEFLRDHVVAGTVVVPGTAFIDIILSAARQTSDRTAWSVRDLVLRAPLSLADDEERLLQCVMNPTADGFDVEMFSAPVDGETQRDAWTLHASATLVGETAATPASVDLDAIRAQCPDSLSSDALYERHAARGIAFGPSFRGVRSIQHGRTQVLAEIAAPADIAGQSDHVVHPALLDACLQPLLAVLPDDDAGSPPTLLLPRGYDSVTVFGAMPSGPVWSHASLRPSADAASLIADIVVTDRQGSVVARIDGFRIARTSAAALGVRSGAAGELYLTEWRPGATTTQVAPTGAWLIFGDRSGVGARVAEQLRAGGATAIVATAGAQLDCRHDEWTLRPDSPADFLKVVRDAAPAGGWSGVVHLWNLDANATTEDAADARDEAAVVGIASALHLAQALLRGHGAAPPLWLVSRGARLVSPSQSSIMPSQALAWGFARALEAEHPELCITRVDLDPAVAANASAIVREISAADSADREVAWREGTRYVPRLVRARRPAATGSASTGGLVRLVAGAGHVIEELKLSPLEAASPGPNDIEIEVAATGLNFRDVLNAIGLAPGGPMPLGGECAGRVRRVGANVSHFAVGDLVMAFAHGSFASRVVVDARRAIALPRGIGLTEAAGLPVAFLTAIYALNTLAGLRAGERVLIHAGAGGVGMAAIQVAKRAGAEVFATAGSPDKRRMLASLGVAHVMDSRTLHFADEIDRITGGAGVDVVLNSLAGDFIARSFDVLARGGRFVEIGKRDIWSAAEVARVRPDAIYLPFDLGDVAADDPETIARLLADLSAALEAGTLRPLPTRSWPLSDAASAFRTMAQARHTGKLVVVHATAPAEFSALRKDGTYLVTGGLGALGLATAQWMAKRGAGRIVLTGRNAPGKSARAAIAAMRASGTTIVVEAVDIADEGQVGTLFRKLSDGGAPLRGIIHAAGVLDDGVVIEQTWQRVARVLAPKVTGGSLLARLARDAALDFFVCYSSATGVFGSPGQSSYSAANAYLDALCQDLRMHGSPATSVQWGAWRDGGMAARQDALNASRWSAKGIRPMAADAALSALELAIASGAPTVAIMSVDWRAVAAQVEAPSRPLLSELLDRAPAPAPATSPASIVPQLAAAPAARRHAILVEHGRSITLRVLGLDAATIVDAGRPLKEFGLDSLTAIELRNALARSLVCALPPTLAFDYPTLDALATHLERRLFPVEAVSIEPAALGRDRGDPRPVRCRCRGPAAGRTGGGRIMSAQTEDAVPLSPIKRALVEIRDLRARLTALEGAAAEPIAVVGLACRLPGGVHDDASLWRVLSEGIDTISEVPADRWDAQARYDADPDRPATMSTRAGGFLGDVAGFDAALFGIAPREAASMDPQQRLMLEVAWEALEDAAIAPDSLVGSATGVFLGVGNSDYGRMLFSSPDHIDAYAGSGGSYAVIAGRLSYVLGLQGPAMAIDTACSASLVAIHLACQSLRARECDLALTGGVNVILAPEAHVAFSKARMLAPDGRCKTFDAAADGYGRGEGAAVVVLRRLSDARARGDRVLALIRGSAVNQDGRSGGLTAPNGPAQEAVIRAALANAGLSPPQIDYVEAHGTGTTLGDPIELQALADVFAEGRPAERPLLVGSCKTNFGHLEAAAGIAGMLKVIAGLRRRRIPPHLHFNTPNPLIDWANIPIEVPTRLQAWPDHAEPARAGVSSFGFSGTNAHVVLEEAPAPADLAQSVERPLHVLALSARDDTALRTLISRFQASLADGAPIADLCFTANSGRAQLARRVAVRGATAAELDAGLTALLAGAAHPGVASGAVGVKAPVVAFLFTGQGAQYHGMARGLYQTSPVFRSVIDRCAAALGDTFDLVGVLYGDNDAARINDTANAQPALFAVEVALAELWRSWGVEPTVMIGHSLGEYAAACVAGVLSVEDGLRLMVTRGVITQALPGDGAMASISAAPDIVVAEIAALGGALSIAAYNGPQHVVVSGERPAVAALVERLSRRGLQCRPLRISHGFHSPLVEPALVPFAKALDQVQLRARECHGDLEPYRSSRERRRTCRQRLLAAANARAGALRAVCPGCDGPRRHTCRRDRAASRAARHGGGLYCARCGGRLAAVAASRHAGLDRLARQPAATLRRRCQDRLGWLRPRLCAAAHCSTDYAISASPLLDRLGRSRACGGSGCRARLGACRGGADAAGRSGADRRRPVGLCRHLGLPRTADDRPCHHGAPYCGAVHQGR